MQLNFRPMRITDLSAVYDIEVHSFADPWQKEIFEMELEEGAYVVETEDEVAGYICFRQVLDECSIINIAVKPKLRRQGIASFMFENLYKLMDKEGVKYYFLEVRASNTTAQSLYHKLGFVPAGLRKRYYHNPDEDAIVMFLDRGEQ